MLYYVEPVVENHDVNAVTMVCIMLCYSEPVVRIHDVNTVPVAVNHGELC